MYRSVKKKKKRKQKKILSNIASLSIDLTLATIDPCRIFSYILCDRTKYYENIVRIPWVPILYVLLQVYVLLLCFSHRIVFFSFLCSDVFSKIFQLSKRRFSRRYILHLYLFEIFLYTYFLSLYYFIIVIETILFNTVDLPTYIFIEKLKHSTRYKERYIYSDFGERNAKLNRRQGNRYRRCNEKEVREEWKGFTIR